MRTIKEEKRKQVVETCRQTSILLEEIQPTLVPWGVETGKLDTLFIAALEKIKEQAKKFPGGWIPVTMGQLGAGSVLCNPDRIEAYLSGPGSSHSPGAVRLLRSVQDRPAFFTPFRVELDHGDELFEIRDYSSNEVHLLLSPALGGTIKHRPDSLLTLLLSNGSCLQAIGPLHYYRGLASVDFHYYARMLQPLLYERSGLLSVVTAFPESFVILDAFSETPSIGHKGRRLFDCWSTFPAPTVDPAALSPSFDQEEAGGLVRFRLKGSDSPFTAADFYWDPGRKEGFICTRDPQDYERISTALKGHVGAPEAPQVVVTPNMEVIARNLLGVDPPVFAWERPFTPPSGGPEAEEALKRLNALLQDILDATNHGRTYDLQKLAARHHLSMEEAQEAEKAVTRQAFSMAIDIPGGLPGVPPVPPSGRMKMREDLGTCEIFRFGTGPEAQHLFQDVAERIQSMRPPASSSRVRTMLTLATLPSILEEVDDPAWEDVEHTVLKYSLYLLCRAGDEYHSTEDYAAEILRLFWQVLTESRERGALRRFTRQYAVWCREVLVRAGLAEEGGPDMDESAKSEATRPGAAFPIRATPFFKAWVRIGKIS